MVKRRYYVFAALALGVYVFAFFDQARKSALPDGAVADSLSYPAVVQGITTATPDQLRYVVEGWAPGEFVKIEPWEEAPRQIQLVHADSLSYRITAFTSGVLFWLIATFVIAPRCGRRAARYFFWMILLYGLGIGLGGVYFNADPWSPRTLFGLLQFGTLAFLPPIFMSLAQTFPRELTVRHRLRPVMVVLWMLAAALTLWEFGTYQAYFLDPTPARAMRLDLPGRVADFVMIVEALAGIALATAQTRGLRTVAEQQQAKWVLVGLVVGATPYVFIRNVAQLIGAEAPFPHHVDRVFELAIPMAFAMATARHRFLDIDIILRRGTVYGFVAGSMSLLVIAVGLSLGRLVPDPYEHWQLLGTGAVAGLTFPYLRRSIGSWVDRTFFRITYDREQAVTRVRNRVDRIGDRENLVRLLADAVTHDLEADLVGVVVGEGARQRVAGSADPFQIRRWWEACVDLPLGIGPMGRLYSTAIPAIERRDFPPLLRDGGVVLVQPIIRQGTCEGAIMCGPRPTGRRYVEQDLNLLADFAAVAVEVLARIALLRAAEAEGAERQRLNELNSLKNKFLAQVAHDLRTPLSSVIWSAANLRDGLAGPLSPDQGRYVRSIGSATSHLNRLVENLIEISHLDSGRVSFASAPLALGAVLKDAVHTVAPVAEAKGVRLDFTVDHTAREALVQANADKLAVVVVNLLDNAVKYSPPDSCVAVGIEPIAEGVATFTIRDEGPGFGRRQDLFRRFTQGEPSPYSQQRGFGLGLFIVKDYFDRLGGTVSLTDHADGGAFVRCTLPLVASAPTERGPA